MHEDLLPAIEGLERAVGDGNARLASTILRELNDKTIFSYNEVYDRLHAVEGKLGVLLFRALEPTEFGQIIASDKHLHSFKVWEALEQIADGVSAAALWEVKDYMGFPSPRQCPKLYAKLAAADDERISQHLVETIDRLATAEATGGIPLSAHERAMSMIHFIRWNPDDKGLAEHVRLLAARGDALARTACARYLMQLPWGADRLATIELLDGMSATRGAENLNLFREALSAHKEPAIVRTWLWGAIGEADPRECLMGAISDLAGAENDSDRLTHIEYLGGAFAHARAEKIALGREVIDAAESVDTTAWSSVVRGLYGTTLRRLLPEADAGRVSNRVDRAAIAVARAWETLRLDHMGCLIPLALMIGLGWLVAFGLDKLLGEPKRAGWIPEVLFLSWIVWSVSNVRTHFSGHETIRRKVGTGLVYFVLLFAAVVAAVVCRVG